MRPAPLAVAAFFVIAAAPVVAQAPQLARMGPEIPEYVAFAPGAADFDGDGDQDLLSIKGNPYGEFFILKNDGGGRFTRQPGVAWPTLQFLVGWGIGDLDGDGDPDVAYVDNDLLGAYRLDFMENDGTGGLVPRGGFLYATACQACSLSPIVFDVDGDADADVLLLGLSSAPRLFLNQGGWSFAEAPGAIPALPTWPRIKVAGDVDGDGDVDCYLDSYFDGVVRFLRNDGGVFTVGATYDLGVAGKSIGFGDFDGDGRTDVVVEYVSAPPASAAQRTTLSFASGAAVVLHSLALSTSHGSLATLDLDDDGIDEVAGSIGDRLEFSRVDAPAPMFVAPGRPSALYAYDVDADGDLDVLYESRTQSMRVLRNSSDGTLVDVDPIVAPSFWSIFGGGAVLHDHDGDGRLDLAGTKLDYSPATGASLGVGPLTVALNDGIGAFPTTLAVSAAAGAQQHLGPTAVADFDADGRDDFAFVQNNQLRVRFSDGVGGFSTLSRPAAQSGEASAIAADDLDGDGAVDIVVAAQSASTGWLHWYRNLGASGFAAGVQLLFQFGGPGVAPLPDFAAFDADLDGDVDLAAPGTAGTTLLLNNGFGVFGNTKPFGVNSAPTIAAGDVDGDGDLDVLIGNQLRLRQGAGYVAGPTAAAGSATASSPRRRLVDLDGDGKADLLASDEWRPALGGGVFGASVAIAPQRSEIVSAGVFWQVADVDLDGDLDLFDGVGEFRWNLLRHLARGVAPALGRTGTLEVYGPANAPYDLLASLPPAAGPIALGSWGLLHLDLGSAFPVVSGALNAAGKSEIAFAIPDVAALEGLALYWQAALPSVGRLTGAVRTVVDRL